tara:strand:+ start:624 stop:1127 length:504 start_codon:yes stop_codon:yes gene_type:complete
MRLLVKLFLLLALPLSAMAEEVAFISTDIYSKYNIAYNRDMDYNYCNINKEICNRIQQDQFVFPKFDIVEKATPAQWALFWSLQTLDVLTTSEGVKYNCVRELNPLLPSKPSIGRLLIHKSTFVGIPMSMGKSFTKRDLADANYLMAVVVVNNFETLNSAKSECSKN